MCSGFKLSASLRCCRAPARTDARNGRRINRANGGGVQAGGLSASSARSVSRRRPKMTRICHTAPTKCATGVAAVGRMACGAASETIVWTVRKMRGRHCRVTSPVRRLGRAEFQQQRRQRRLGRTELQQQWQQGRLGCTGSRECQRWRLGNIGFKQHCRRLGQIWRSSTECRRLGQLEWK